MNIKDYCVEIFNLLISVREDSWSKEFASIINGFEDFEKSTLLHRIGKIYAGMGSFSDLVLYKDGALCFEENEKLDELRKRLFEELKRNH